MRAMMKDLGMISGWLFPDENGERLETRHLYTKWITYLKQHGISVTIHELRHTFISLVKNVMPEPMLKSAVGHSEPMDTYGVYGHEVTGEMLKAAEIVDEVFDEILKDDCDRHRATRPTTTASNRSRSLASGRENCQIRQVSYLLIQVQTGSKVGSGPKQNPCKLNVYKGSWVVVCTGLEPVTPSM